MDKPLDRKTVEPLLKAVDVAHRLNISRTSAYRLMGTEIPCVRLGVGIIRVRHVDLDSYINKCVSGGECEENL